MLGRSRKNAGGFKMLLYIYVARGTRIAVAQGDQGPRTSGKAERRKNAARAPALAYVAEAPDASIPTTIRKNHSTLCRCVFVVILSLCIPLITCLLVEMAEISPETGQAQRDI